MSVPADLNRFSELVDLVYQGAVNPTSWARLVPAVAEWLRAPRCWLFTPMHNQDKGGFCVTYPVAPSMIQLWREKYYALDVWSAAGVRQNKFYEGNVVIGEDLVPERELITTRMYQEFMLPHNVHHLLSGIVYGVTSADLMPTVCSFFRSASEPGFGIEDADKMRLLVPHLSRALGVMQRLRDAEFKVAASLAALDKLASGVLLFGADAQLLFVNRAAQRMLEAEDGLALRAAPGIAGLGRLAIHDARIGDAVDAAIRQAIAPDLMQTPHFSRFIAVPRPSGRASYALNFSSMPARNEFGSGADTPRAIVFITDSAAPVSVNAALMRSTYGLTPAEVRVAVAMAEGLTMNQAADRFGVKLGTVRTQLKSVYDKTSTGNRAQLVKLILMLSEVPE